MKLANPALLKTIAAAAGMTLLLHSGLSFAADGYAIESLSGDSGAGYDFGQKIINWVAYGSDTGSHGERSLLSVLSATLNTIALFMMAFLAMFGGLNYVIQTANKGVPGGQVISSFWMPLRISVATILMVPLTSGFSALQYGVTSVAETGNKHANILMEKGLNYIYDFGVYRPISLVNGDDIVFSWIGSEVCKQYINAYTGSNTIQFQTATSGDVTKGFETKFQYAYAESSSSARAANPRSNYCGSITIASPGKGKIPTSTGPFNMSARNAVSTEMASQAQSQLISVITGLQPAVAAIAAKILADQSALQSMQSGGSGAQSSFESALKEVRGNVPGLVGDINRAIASYNDGRQRIVAQAVSNANSEAIDGADWKSQTIDGGWPLLGTIFWKVSINQAQINSLAQLMLATTTDPQIDNEWAQDERLQEISQRILAAKKAYGRSGSSVLQSSTSVDAPIPSLSAIALSGAEGADMFDSLKMALYSGLSWVTRSALQRNSPDDLIVNIQYMGSAIGTAAEVMYLVKGTTLTGIQAAASAAEQAGEIATTSNFWTMVFPVGLGVRAVGAGGSITKDILSALSQFLLPMVDSILTILIGIGFVAGVVLPTIPLSIWFMGVISWTLFYIECLLVSPFWLAAHGTAEKEGWGTEHTRQGYMLMIGLYLNPILRVAGFFAIFIALKPVAYMVAWFFDYVHGVLESGFVFLFSSVGGVVVCVMFGYSGIVRVFGLPSELFERGLRWINGGSEVTGDGHSEEKVRSNFMAFVSKAEHTGQRMSQGSMSPPKSGQNPKGNNPKGDTGA
jgi:conjugal transfer/type IV secretion protein DotA/TraY